MSKVARGLRSFGNQIAKVASSAGELSFEVQGATKSISLMGADGNLKSTYQVLKEISAEWDNMTSAERQTLGISLAGKTQFEVFTSVLNNFEGAEKALTLAIESEGSAWRENARYMESIEAKTQALKTAVENLILGDGGLEKLVKNVLDISTKIVKLIDDCGGLVTVVGMLTGVMIMLNANGIVKLIGGLTSLANEAIFATASFIATGQAITTTGVAINTTVPIIGAIVLGFTALVAIVNYVNEAYDRHLEKVKEFNSEVSTQTNVVKEIEDELKSLYERINNIKELGQLELTDEEELRSLKLETIELERQLAVEKEKLKIAQQKAEVEAYEVLTANPSKEEKSLQTGKTGYTVGMVAEDAGISSDMYAKQSDNLDVRISKYVDIKKALEDYVLTLQEEQATLDKNSKEYTNNEMTINAVSGAIQQYSEVIDSLITDLGDATIALSEESATRQAYIEVYNKYADAIIESTSAEEAKASAMETVESWLQSTIETLGLTAEQESELRNKVYESVDGLESQDEILQVAQNTLTQYEDEIAQASQATKTWNERIDDIQSSYSTLSSAVEEYNSSEGLTIDTLQSLLSLSPEYLSMLDFENGKLVLNEEALINKTNALMNEAKATVYSEAVERIKARMDEALNKTSRNASDGLDVETEALNRNSEALAENNKQLYQNLVLEAGNAKVDISDIVKDVENQIKAIDSVVKGVNLNFSKTMTSAKDKTDKANKSLDKTNDKLKTTNERLEKLKETVKEIQDDVSEDEKVISYINGKLDEEIERLENLRDAEVEAIEDQIDALDKLQEEQEKQAKERIKLLEEERDTLIDSNKLQINELEKRQNAEEEYWNNKIQALKDQNQALQDQADLEKLLENLEKAKNTKVRVYKEGQGFVWDTDQTAVTKAQKEIEAYNRKKAYEDQLKELENFKKSALKNYEEQINDLKTLNDNIKNQYDKQINTINNELEIKKKAYEEEKKILQDKINTIKSNYQTQIDYFKNFKEQFNKQVNAYNDEQLRLLALEKTGIDFENENWKTRLDNLDNFVKNYNNKLAELSQKQKELAELEKQLKDTNNAINNISVPSAPSSNNGGGGGGGGGNGHGSKTVWTAGGNEFGTRGEAETWLRNEQNRVKSHNDGIDAQINSIKNSPHPNQSYIRQLESEKWSMPSGGIGQKVVYYATGISTIKDNQFAIVGDDPRNKELVVGAKLNGMAMQLKKGTGVVNAKSTNTVAGLLNGLGSELGKASTGNYNLSNMNTNNNNQSIHIGTISLPQVRDSDDFITALKNFENLMAQRAYASI